MVLNTSTTPSRTQPGSSLPRFSSADTYGTSLSIAERDIRDIRLDFFTDPSYTNQRASGAYSDSLLDLLPEKPGTVSSANHRPTDSSAVFRLSDVQS